MTNTGLTFGFDPSSEGFLLPKTANSLAPAAVLPFFTITCCQPPAHRTLHPPRLSPPFAQARFYVLPIIVGHVNGLLKYDFPSVVATA